MILITCMKIAGLNYFLTRIQSGILRVFGFLLKNTSSSTLARRANKKLFLIPHRMKLYNELSGCENGHTLTHFPQSV